MWEVLDNGLKSKMEIQWSDISAMNATFPESLPGSLEIEVCNSLSQLWICVDQSILGKEHIRVVEAVALVAVLLPDECLIRY